MENNLSPIENQQVQNEEQKAYSVQATPTMQAEPKKTHIIKLFSLAIVLVLTLGAVGWYFFAKKSSNENTFTPVANKIRQDYLANSHKVYCVELGFEYIRCEHLETGEVAKYKVPTDFMAGTRKLTSPNGEMILASYWNEQSVEEVAVLDGSFKKVKTLDKGSNAGYSVNDFNWLSDELIVVSESKNSDPASPQVISTININTGEKKQITKRTNDYLYDIIGGDTTNMYAYRQESYAKDLLVRISVSDGKETIIEVDKETRGALSQNAIFDGMSYLPATGAFLIPNDDSGQNNSLAIARVDASREQLKLKIIQEVTAQPMVSYVGDYVLTTKGIVSVTHDKDRVGMYPHFVQTSSGTKTTLKLAYQDSTGFSMAEFPALKKESSNQPVVEDFVKFPQGTPTKIQLFAKDAVKSGCRENEYKTIKISSFDGEGQFMALEGGCGRDAAYYYILRNGKYEEVASTQEGMGCEERDRLGISAKVTECRMPGEGL